MKLLIVGIGCRRGVSAAQIEAAVRAALGAHSIDAVREVATLDSKAHEPGLVDFCARFALPLRLFTRAQIAAPPAVMKPSVAARAHLGIDGVCEPCARLAAPAGRLIVGKTALDGVTVAIASATDDAHGRPTRNPPGSQSNHQDFR